MKEIQLEINGKTIALPNSWDTISQEDYLVIVKALVELYQGRITPNEVLCRYVCSALGLSFPKIVKKHHVADLLSIASLVSFIFDRKSLAPKISFARQFMPRLAGFASYSISTECSCLTCSLSALQYIEAVGAMEAGEAQMPLLAATLYCPQPYDTAKALDMVTVMRKQSPVDLLAVRMVFEALVNFIYSRTHFSILAKFKAKSQSPIATTMADSLFDLATEGYGTVGEVEQINVITYLSILRKKTIDTVLSMRSMEMSTPEIASRTSLPIEVINDIVHPAPTTVEK